MRIKRWASLAVAAGTLVGVATIPTTAQAAAQTLSIQVGGDGVVGGVAFEGMRFFAPPTLSVHKGDTITFNFAGFHTATVLPDDQTPQEWRTENQAGLTSPYSIAIPDADDTTSPTFEFNPAVVFPSDPTCGTASAPCSYDGKSLVNSGAPLASTSFTVTINDNIGAVVWVVCLIHADMQMRLQVVADTATATTQSDIDSYKSSQQAADHEAAAALVPRLEKPTKHKTSSGQVVWDAFAGFDGDGWGLDAMFPKTLHVSKGDTVRWHFTQLMGNLHTVTFPRSQAVSLNAAFGTPTCEGASGDTPPDAAPPAFCSTGPQNFELEIPPAALVASGTHSYAGSGLHSSGVEGADAPSNAPYNLKFTKVSSKKGFTYACIVHGGMMSGAVVVS